MNARTPDQRPLEEVIYALPPMGGVLGAACTWHLRALPEAPQAAREAVARLLAIWRLDDTVVCLAGLVVEELVAGAVAHGASPVMLEAARRPGRIAFAVRDAAPSSTGDAPALSSDISFAETPGQTGTAVVAEIADTPVLATAHASETEANTALISL
ncbi:ATP-binding protein [Streptomyces sp. NPDC006475]|uniref:ATP-binding protein n=1 Tax=Streptomyces sp. NPDC006475 TaxID=3155719 RepID=UPI0033A49F34